MGAVVRTTTPASTDKERDEDRCLMYLKETFGDEGDN